MQGFSFKLEKVRFYQISYLLFELLHVIVSRLYRNQPVLFLKADDSEYRTILTGALIKSVDL